MTFLITSFKLKQLVLKISDDNLKDEKAKVEFKIKSFAFTL